MTKKTDVAGKTPAETSQASDSSVPVWKAQHGRVQGAMWTHTQDGGKTRITLSLCRSYKDKFSGKWNSVHYYDPKDIADLRSILDVAEDELLTLTGKARAVGED